MTFLNAEFSYPTSMGLPMKLSTQGSSALKLKLDGKIDIPSIMKSPKNTYFKLQIIPR